MVAPGSVVQAFPEMVVELVVLVSAQYLVVHRREYYQVHQLEYQKKKASPRRLGVRGIGTRCRYGSEERE